ncbi:hypothetical protein ACYFX5_11810 [Bremerella sp. T1]|uniref:hypothetical protein n=1 Tax=Bremerella sp. TYQ1 TaxID=3119568 RepID=UPI001CD02303|nr:hypothetical protein [Bremerella volcania]UBM33758.1 hypothetical protein LA756_13755 [Bremerella volcania]
MTQTEIVSAVSRATGEDLAEIRRRGFSIADPFEIDFDPEPDDLLAQSIDWDNEELGQPTPMAGPIDHMVA